MKRRTTSLELSVYECGAVFDALNEKRTALLRSRQPTDTVDDALLKVISAMENWQRKERKRNGAR